MSNFMSNRVLEICNLYWFKLTCSATQTWNLGIGNYEHLIYYQDNENKSLPDCGQAIMVENETPAHLQHYQDSSEVNPRHLIPAITPVCISPKERDICTTGA